MKNNNPIANTKKKKKNQGHTLNTVYQLSMSIIIIFTVH